MTVTDILITLAEIAFGGFIIWGFWHEEKVVEFEDRLFAKLGFKVKKHHTAKITKFNSKSNRNKNCI